MLNDCSKSRGIITHPYKHDCQNGCHMAMVYHVKNFDWSSQSSAHGLCVQQLRGVARVYTACCMPRLCANVICTAGQTPLNETFHFKRGVIIQMMPIKMV